VTTVAAALEFQREEPRALRRTDEDPEEACGRHGSGIEYAYTMVHKAPQSAKSPQKVAGKAKH
jgi:hypothetical protein